MTAAGLDDRLPCMCRSLSPPNFVFSVRFPWAYQQFLGSESKNGRSDSQELSVLVDPRLQSENNRCHELKPAIMANLDSVVSRIANFRLTGPVEDDLYSQLDDLFEKLINLSQSNFSDPTRSVCLNDVAPFAHRVFRHVLRLRQRLESGEEEEIDFYESTSESHQALTKLLRFSFDDECRKAEVSLGLVSTVAEWLVLDVAVFGLQRDKSSKETRRAIGNSLTNLTYSNAFAKSLLCKHPGFLREVNNLLDNVPELVQSYGALIRNLSWNADSSMVQALAQTVPSLARTVVRIHNAQELSRRTDSVDDNKCLISSMSALWNLSSASTANKQAMCETPDFLVHLIGNLSNEPDRISLVENYSGVLKYLAGFIAEREELLHSVHEVKIIRHLLGLLNSSSFTVILNVLGALGPLTAKDPRTQLKLMHSEAARLIFDNLRNSVREDVRNGVKVVLTNLNCSPLAGCSMSMPRESSTWSAYSTGRRGLRLSAERGDVQSAVTSNQRLLPHRQGWQHFIQSPDDDRRQPTNNYFGTFPYSRRANLPIHRTTVETTQDQPSPVGMSDSVLGTGVGSLQSLTADIPSTWQSNLTTARNSVVQSPFSPSNLPDSPSDLLESKVDRLDHSAILDDAIKSVMPKPRAATSSTATHDGSTILEECLARVLPSPRRRGPQFATSALLESSNTEKTRHASNVNSDDNFYIADSSNEAIDVVLPKDVEFEADCEHLEIDCARFELTRHSNSQFHLEAPEHLGFLLQVDGRLPIQKLLLMFSHLTTNSRRPATLRPPSLQKRLLLRVPKSRICNANGESLIFAHSDNQSKLKIGNDGA